MDRVDPRALNALMEIMPSDDHGSDREPGVQRQQIHHQGYGDYGNASITTHFLPSSSTPVVLASVAVGNEKKGFFPLFRHRKPSYPPPQLVEAIEPSSPLSPSKRRGAKENTIFGRQLRPTWRLKRSGGPSMRFPRSRPESPASECPPKAAPEIAPATPEDSDDEEDIKDVSGFRVFPVCAM